MISSQGIVDALISGNPDQPELPPGPSIETPPSLVRDIARAAVKKFIDARKHGKPVYDHDIHDHGIMYSDYFQGVSTVHTNWDDVYTGTGENAHEALDDALENAAMDDWDVRSIPNEFDPNSPDNVQNTVRGNNPDMDEDDAADGVYYYISVFVRGVPETVEEAADPAMLKRLGRVAITAGKKKFAVGQSISRGTSRSEKLVFSFLDALESIDKAKANEIRHDYREEIDIAGRFDEGEVGLAAHAYAIVDDFLNETLHRIMQDYCPPFTYFGANEGDGTDIGCWPNTDRFHDAENYGDEELTVWRGDSEEATRFLAGTLQADTPYVFIEGALVPGPDSQREDQLWDARRRKIVWTY